MHSFGVEDHYDSKSLAKGLKSRKNEDEKTFNRYVRQLVDQYLDKEVVISKQPEDQVELIVQACRDKFPDFAHWTTTRIRIYIESCRRLKKIKNSPLLLAKRKAAGRRFREGQKLKKIIASQYTIQAAEANRQLAEYLIRSGGNTAPFKQALSRHFEPMQQGPLNGILNTDREYLTNEPASSPFVESKDTSTFRPLTNLMTQNNSINPVLSSLMQMSPSVLQPTSILEPKTISAPNITLAQFPTLAMSNMVSRQLPTMAPPTFNSPVLRPLVVSPRTPSASPPNMMTTTLFKASPQDAPKDNTIGTPVHVPKELSVSDTIGKVINDMLQNEKSKRFDISKAANIFESPSKTWANTSPQVLPSTPPLQRETQPSPKQKNFQIESLMNSSFQDQEMTPIDAESGITSPSTGSLSPNQDNSPSLVNMSDIMNAKTLVTSYREAANFLYRAASELEQLIPTDHRVF